MIFISLSLSRKSTFRFHPISALVEQRERNPSNNHTSLADARTNYYFALFLLGVIELDLFKRNLSKQPPITQLTWHFFHNSKEAEARDFRVQLIKDRDRNSSGTIND